MQLALDAEDVMIMLAGETLYDEHAKKWLVDEKMEINGRRKYEAAKAATTRTRAEKAVRMRAEEVPLM